jgi:branched-chain amino acid transport system permease protein
VVGGVATISGPAIGAFFVQFVPEWTKGSNEQLSPVLFGALLILLMMVAPGGIVGLLRQAQAWVRRQILARRGPPEEPAPGEPPGDPPTRDEAAVPVP